MVSYETERLLMRPLRPDDEAFYCACYTNATLMKHIGEPLCTEAAIRGFKTELKIASEIQQRRYLWVLQDKSSGLATGLLGMFRDRTKNDVTPLHAEIGHIMLTEYQNRGFTKEAFNKLMDIVFSETRLTAIVISHNRENKAVSHAARKLGFLRDMTFPADDTRLRCIFSRSRWQEVRAKTSAI